MSKKEELGKVKKPPIFLYETCDGWVYPESYLKDGKVPNHTRIIGAGAFDFELGICELSELEEEVVEKIWDSAKDYLRFP